MTEAVQIRYDTPIITTASVTDDLGDHWVCRTASQGWSCDCSEDDAGCVHVLAVKQTTGRR
jgi:hypothetical protein